MINPVEPEFSNDGEKPLFVEEEWYGQVLRDGAIPRDRLSHTKGVDFEGQPLLLEQYRKLFDKLVFPVVGVDDEGGQHYNYELTESEIKKLKNLPLIDGIDTPEGVFVSIEDRPWGRRLDGGDIYTYPWGIYTNPWGDLVLLLCLEYGEVATTYTLTAFSDEKYPHTDLAKYTTSNEKATSGIGEMALQIVGLIGDPLESEVGFNDIDEIEHKAIVKLMTNIAQVVG